MKLRNKKTGEIAEIKLKLNESLPDAIRRTIEEAGWEETREPLIKDEKIRKVIRAWSEANGVDRVILGQVNCDELVKKSSMTAFGCHISFEGSLGLERGRNYTIEELCGEEKPRPVIVNDVKYSSYEDYLKSREKK
jgi:hypothetical protein